MESRIQCSQIMKKGLYSTWILCRQLFALLLIVIFRSVYKDVYETFCF